MLSESQLPTIINSLSKTDNEVLYYTLNKPKTFKHYKQEDKRTLATYLIGICSILGIKVGKLSVDNNHYQSLSPMYLSSIVNAYKKHKLLVYKRYKQELDTVRRETPSIKPTDKEVIDTSINLINLEYEDYLVDPDEYRDSDFRYTQYKYIYQFLLKYGLVNQLYKYNDRDLKTVVVNVFFEIKKSNTEVKQWLRDNYMRKSKKQ